MDTTIQISKDLLEKLQKMKMHNKESYEDIIWDLIEDRMEISEETKKEIEEGRKEIKEGRFVTLENIKKKYKIN
jgi:predicted transcriptional regulator